MKILKFQADWCGPCHAIKPVIEKVAEEAGLEIQEIDIDANPELSESYGIQSIPTILLVEDAVVIARHTGSAPASVIKSNLGL